MFQRVQITEFQSMKYQYFIIKYENVLISLTLMQCQPTDTFLINLEMLIATLHQSINVF